MGIPTHHFVPSTVLATGLVAGLGVFAGAAHAESGNHIHVIIERVADDFTPEANFFMLCDVVLPDEAGVTGVTVTTPGGSVIELEDEGDGEWNEEIDYADVPALKLDLDGIWTVQVLGTAASTSTFALNLGSLADDDLYPLPVLLAPESGATGVPVDVVFVWTDPTGDETADVLSLEVESDNGNLFQEDDSLDGGLSVDDTTWDPPLDLLEGENEFALMYLEIDDAGRAGAATATTGSIVWGTSPFAPMGYPDGAPLLVLGSERIINFTVGVPCPGDIDGDDGVGFTDVLAILSAWGPCGGCPEDLDGSGDVGFLDLLEAISTWGPCP